jgi:hypothetical protein
MPKFFADQILELNFGNNLKFWHQFWISATVWILASLGFGFRHPILSFNNGLEFQQWSGILATVWDFGDHLGSWQ